MKVLLRLCPLLLLLLTTYASAGILADIESPLTTDAKWILGTGAALTIGVIATQDSWSGPWETQVAKNQPLGDSSKYGDALGQNLPNALYAGGFYLASRYGTPKALGRAWLMFEATVYASAVTLIMKKLEGEGRPYDLGAGSSFPSGHSSSAFSFAGVVAAEHGWAYGVPAMLMATFVGYSRINDNQHRLHDVVGGATIGLACAYGVYYAHRDSEAQRVLFMPMPVQEGAGIVASWQIQ